MRFVNLVRARTGRFSANLEFELPVGRSLLELATLSLILLTNPYEVRLATPLRGDKEFQNRKPE